ncbi:MAG: KUP/HAK/KT family potassium transporter, partial [Rhodospirillales bacterium]|nr:KUP/HAK/KT family potassium transporter [Rhodospirillales bacterium]
RWLWRWSWAVVAPMALLFLTVDFAFLGANILKIPQGGWFPLVIGAVAFLLMITWKQGKAIVAVRLADDSLPLMDFLERVSLRSPVQVPGTAVFMAANKDIVPGALLHNLKHNKVMHARVVIVTVVPEMVAHISEERRFTVEQLAEGFYRVVIRFGFVEQPNVPAVLQRCRDYGLDFDMMDTSFFISRETLIPTAIPGMALWREALFAAMSRNAASATDFFCIPANRVIELGTQVQL